MKHRLLSLALALALCLGLAVIPAGAAANDIVQIAAGDYTFLMLTEGGVLYGVGGPHYQLVGDYKSSNRSSDYVTTPIVLMTDVKAMDTMSAYAGFWIQRGSMMTSPFPFTLAIKTNGDLYAWGDNLAYQLGQGDREQRDGPVFVMSNVKEVSCGGAVGAAVTESGDLYIWGTMGVANSTLPTVSYTIPTKVLSNVKDVACGGDHILALTNDGAVYAMGSTSQYALGNGVGFNVWTGNYVAPDLVREMVKVFDNCIAVSAGKNYSLALRADGTLFGWGDNTARQMGYYSQDLTKAVEKTPHQIMTGVKAIQAGGDFALVLKTDNTLWGMGDTEDWDFGMGTNEYYANGNVPVKVASNVKLFAASSSTTAYVTTGGVMYACGLNIGDQITTDYPQRSTIGRRVPTPMVCGLSVGDKFADVPFTNFAHDPVTWAADKGITTGTSATTFSPNATCNQAQILTFLWRAKGSPRPAGAVSGSEYYSSAVQWAQEQGLIAGAVSPEAPCTRADVVTYLWKLAGSPAAGSAGFTDVPSSAAYAQAVAWAVEQGITTGIGNNQFGPDAACTRGQIVTFLYRCFA